MKINKEKEKKLRSWIKNLTRDQTLFISDLIKAEAEKSTTKILSVLDLCLFAAISECLPELNTEEIQDIIEMFAKEITANKKYILADKEELEMIKEQELRAEQLTIQLLEQDKDQKTIIETLKKEFRQLTASDIKNIYKRTKDKWVLPQVPIVTKKVRDSQLPIECKKLTGEDIKILDMEEKSFKKNIQKDSSEKIEILDPIRLKYNGQVITIANDYIECIEGKFDTLEELEKYKEEEIKNFTDRIENIKYIVNKFSF